ncbi:hypothetical protein [Paracoccus sp. PAR01]|uniref:hypothetical protein n=1 Tax=Paracoccus sp. PAR01 TaxID=2769282 RepID=UPI001781BADC|nr:hypothetical protein [Paracoccus sp. PAR01]MBD9526591.1 hypothetical protein [Paracoccus sp. PAR01]
MSSNLIARSKKSSERKKAKSGLRAAFVFSGHRFVTDQALDPRHGEKRMLTPRMAAPLTFDAR